MATYIPDATQGSEPVDSQKASTMGLEFRTLKTYIQDTILPLINSKAPLSGAGAGGVWNITAVQAYNANNVNDFSGSVSTAGVMVASSTPGRGSIGLNQGGTGQTGFVALYNPDSTRKAYIGYAAPGVGGSILLVAEDGAFWNFSSPIVSPHLYGNADSANTVPWTGVSGHPTKLSQFENDIGAGGGTGGTPAGVSSFNSRTGGVVLQPGDVTTALGYTPYNNSNPAGYTTIAGVSAAGFQTTTGTVANALAVTGAGSNGFGGRTISTSGPSGGVDGDIWYVV